MGSCLMLPPQRCAQDAAAVTSILASAAVIFFLFFFLTPCPNFCKIYIPFVQSLCCFQLFAAPQTTARQISLPFTISQNLLKLMSIELMMPCNHLILPSIFPSIKIFSSELSLHIRWPKYWSFSFSISPSSEYSELISFRID